MNKQNYFEYLKTILLTIGFTIVLIFILLGIIRHQVYTEMAAKNIQENAIDYYLVNVLIEKNKYLEKQNPKNYIINLKLGMLYEVKSDFKNAKFEYKQAISKAPLGEARPKYKLALLYLRQNRLDDAQDMVGRIEDAPSKSIIKFKVDIFNKLGDKYYNRADYETAQEEYQKALFYAKKIHSEQLESIKAGLASSYVYFAEEKVKAMQIDEAINSLQMALSIVNAPIIKYKLALLLVESKPDSALKYFDEVFDEEPTIINYDRYNQFLSNLATKADSEGATAKAKLYRLKIKRLKEYYKNNILSIEDLSIENPEGTIKLNKWTKKYNINLDFKLKNVSKYDINSLFVEIIFKDGNTVIGSYLKQLVDNKFPLKAGKDGATVSIKTDKYKSLDDKTPKIITAEIYATKKEDSYKILLDKFNIIEKVKVKKKFK